MTSDPSAPGTHPGVSPGIVALQSSLATVADATNALRADVQAAEKASIRRTRINLVLVGVLVLLVGAVLAIGWQLKQTNDRVADCTTVGGKCYEEGRKRTGEAIRSLTRISIYVSQCGRLWPGESGPEYDKKLERCVADRLAEATNPPPVGPQPSPSTDPPPSPAS